MLNLREIIGQRTKYNLPKWLLHPLERLLHIEEINNIISAGQNLAPQEFLRYVFRWFDVSYDVANTAPIDDHRYIFVANHPFGALDGMMLADMLLRRWSDVGVIVNDLLMHIEPLRELWIPVNKYGRQHSAELYHQSMRSATKQLLTFPAGMCSRWVDGRVADLRWRTRFVKDAEYYNRLIVPIYVDGTLSSRFYNIYKVRRALGLSVNVELLLLVDELFRQRGTRVKIVVGRALDLRSMRGGVAECAASIRNEVYALRRFIPQQQAINHSAIADKIW